MLAEADHPVLIATITAASLVIVAIVQNWRTLRKSTQTHDVATDTNATVEELQAQVTALARRVEGLVDPDVIRTEFRRVERTLGGVNERLDRVDAQLEAAEVNRAQKTRRRKTTEGGS